MCRATGFRMLLAFGVETDIRPSHSPASTSAVPSFLITIYRTVGIFAGLGFSVKGDRRRWSRGFRAIILGFHHPRPALGNALSWGRAAWQGKARALGSWSSHRQREILFSVHGNTGEEASDERETANHSRDHHRRPALRGGPAGVHVRGLRRRGQSAQRPRARAAAEHQSRGR